jgi:predicted nucleic acid-binding protein
MDDQSQARIRAEAEAVELVLRLVRTGEIEWASSVVLQAELENDPDENRCRETKVLLGMASRTIPLDSRSVERARALEADGYGAFDALHLSVAESAGAGVLLTTDDRFIKRAARGTGSPRIPVLNPVEWIRNP